jgi:hypothetical protein
VKIWIDSGICQVKDHILKSIMPRRLFCKENISDYFISIYMLILAKKVVSCMDAYLLEVHTQVNNFPMFYLERWLSSITTVVTLPCRKTKKEPPELVSGELEFSTVILMNFHFVGLWKKDAISTSETTKTLGLNFVRRYHLTSTVGYFSFPMMNRYKDTVMNFTEMKSCFILEIRRHMEVRVNLMKKSQKSIHRCLQESENYTMQLKEQRTIDWTK